MLHENFCPCLSRDSGKQSRDVLTSVSGNTPTVHVRTEASAQAAKAGPSRKSNHWRLFRRHYARGRGVARQVNSAMRLIDQSLNRRHACVPWHPTSCHCVNPFCPNVACVGTGPTCRNRAHWSVPSALNWRARRPSSDPSHAIAPSALNGARHDDRRAIPANRICSLVRSDAAARCPASECHTTANAGS